MSILQIIYIIISISILIITGGCLPSVERLNDIGRAPQMNQIESPVLQENYKPVSWPHNEVETLKNQESDKKNSNSLWKTAYKVPFRKANSISIGEIIKIKIVIDDRATINNSTERSRGEKREAKDTPNITGVLPDKVMHALPFVDAMGNLITSGNSKNRGEGKISRNEKMKMDIAAMVTQILPNGNLIINGNQQIRINHELREISIEGIVRPEDIDSNNSISSDKIAEARISYGGRGLISDVQQPKIGNQIIDMVSPF